jgi:hypothetical protein
MLLSWAGVRRLCVRALPARRHGLRPNDALSVFVQRAPDAPFDLAWRFPLAEA